MTDSEEVSEIEDIEVKVVFMQEQEDGVIVPDSSSPLGVFANYDEAVNKIFDHITRQYIKGGKYTIAVQDSLVQRRENYLDLEAEPEPTQINCWYDYYVYDIYTVKVSSQLALSWRN